MEDGMEDFSLKKLYMKILIFAKQFVRPPSKWRP